MEDAAMGDNGWALLDSAPYGAVLLDGDGAVLECNPAAQRMLGFGVSALPSGLRPPLAGPVVLEAVGAEQRPLEFVGVPVDGGGAMLYIRDLARERAAEAALAHRDAVAATVRDAMIETDTAFRIVSWNRAAETMYGWTAAEVVGRPVDDVLRTELPPGVRERLLDELAGEGHVLTLATQRTCGGGTIEVEASVIALRDGAGAPIGYVSVNRDVTRRRRLEERLQETRHLEIVGRLAGGVAHDLNSLLTAILGYADLAMTDPGLPAHVRPDLEQIVRAAERAGLLTGQLLTFGRQQQLAPRIVDLNVILADTIQARRRLAGSGVELVDVPAPEPARVEVDPTLFERALLDIVANAGEAMPGGGTLTVAVATVMRDGAGPAVRLTVTDTGEGVDAKTRSRAFEPFFTTKAGHTGLGLSTVHGIVLQSGGEVELDAAPGAGTTVSIYLPPAP